MGSYTIVSDIGNMIIGLLKEEMVPEIIASADAIGMCSPAEKENVSLGLYLYDVRESESVRVNGMQSDGLSRQKYPPMYLDLYYMLTAYSMSDAKFRSSEEQRILGRVMQILHDHPSISPETMTFGASPFGETIRIEMMQINTEEKVKLWNNPNTAYRLSVFYKVSPVLLESTRSVATARVTALDFTVDES